MPVRRLLGRYLDVAAVLAAVIPVLALGAPIFGWAMGAGGWILQRVIEANEHRLTPRSETPRGQLGIRLFAAFGRIWLLAIAIVIAGLAGHRAAGLTAALVIFGAYSIAFVMRVLSGPPQTRRTAE